MRYSNATQILHLCAMITARYQGISLQDIMDSFEVSRRTAERMRDAALALLNNIEELRDEHGRKRWRAEGGITDQIGITAEDLATMSAAADLLRQNNRQAEADRLSDVANRVMARQNRSNRRRMEPDLELLLQSEGLALRPGPRVVLDSNVIDLMHKAILMSRRVRVTYTGRLNSAPRQSLLEPYGFLYGNRPYLVARSNGHDTYLHYRLQGISNAKLSDETFARDPNFDLAAHAAKSFGAFREEPFDVVWRFRPEAAKDAGEYIFHPDQTTETTADGALIVRFHAGGALEMAWHLLTWGDAVEVIEPADLWERARISRARFA